MATIGYVRVSTIDQDLDIQVAALKREGCTTIRSEKRSGPTTQGREELRKSASLRGSRRPRLPESTRADPRRSIRPRCAR
jgi:hypothetical protein